MSEGVGLKAVLATAKDRGLEFAIVDGKLAWSVDKARWASCPTAMKDLILKKKNNGEIEAFLKGVPPQVPAAAPAPADAPAPGDVPPPVETPRPSGGAPQPGPEAGSLPAAPPNPPCMGKVISYPSSTGQKNSELFPGSTTRPQEGPARAAAAPAYSRSTPAPLPVHSGTVPAPAAPAPPLQEPAGSPDRSRAPEPRRERTVRRVLLRAEGPGRDLTQDPYLAYAQCWPCSMVYYCVDREDVKDLPSCARCHGTLVGISVPKPEGLKASICWVSRVDCERSKLEAGSPEMVALNERYKADPGLRSVCLLPCYHEGPHEWNEVRPAAIAPTSTEE